MSISRTAFRSLGVIAAASGLALAGAGIASATTSESSVDGNTVSVTFTLEDGDLADACAAVLVPPAAAAELLGTLGGDAGGETEGLAPAALPAPGDIIGGLLAPLKDVPGVVILKGDLLPYALLVGPGDEGTVSADDVPSNLYLQATFCASDLGDESFAPAVSPVLVGNPLEALGAMSSDGLLDTASALLQGGGNDGMGAVLSSALGGGDAEA